MNQSILGYNPRCSMYAVEQKKGTMFYVSYYLPNGERMRRPVSRKKSEAKRLIKIKEIQLIQGQFDQKDLAKFYDGLSTGSEVFVKKETRSEEPEKKKERIKIDDALKLYFEITSSRKTMRTQIQDLNCIRARFLFFQKQLGRIFMDEITGLDVQKLIHHLDVSGKAESTIRGTATSLKKVFNWLINEAKLLDAENPVPAKNKLPKKGGGGKGSVDFRR